MVESLQWHPATILIIAVLTALLSLIVATVLKFTFAIQVINPALSLIILMVGIVAVLEGIKSFGLAKEAQISVLITAFVVLGITALIAFYGIPYLFKSTVPAMSIYSITG